MAANLTTKGVTSTGSEGLTTLAGKILSIPSGGGGGCTRMVTGSFTTGSTRASAGSITINYTGNGYPIACVVYIDGGAALPDHVMIQQFGNIFDPSAAFEVFMNEKQIFTVIDIFVKDQIIFFYHIRPESLVPEKAAYAFRQGESAAFDIIVGIYEDCDVTSAYLESLVPCRRHTDIGFDDRFESGVSVAAGFLGVLSLLSICATGFANSVCNYYLFIPKDIVEGKVKEVSKPEEGTNETPDW